MHPYKLNGCCVLTTAEPRAKMGLVNCILAPLPVAYVAVRSKRVVYSLFDCTTCLKRPLKKKTKMGFKTDYRLMQVKSIAEYSKGSILQYFRPSLSYHLLLRPLFYLFLSGRLRQVLL